MKPATVYCKYTVSWDLDLIFRAAFFSNPEAAISQQPTSRRQPPPRRRHLWSRYGRRRSQRPLDFTVQGFEAAQTPKATKPSDLKPSLPGPWQKMPACRMMCQPTGPHCQANCCRSSRLIVRYEFSLQHAARRLNQHHLSHGQSSL